MEETVKIVYEGGQGEVVEKKSRFLADVTAVDSEEEAAVFVEFIRKKYWDARHHCSAYVLGERSEISRCSDDGEPSGTAGRPILDVLLGAGVRNACIVVTRYFGGTLLGTGGLVRAYGRAAREGLAASIVLEQINGKRLRLTCDYNSLGKIQYLAGNRGLRALESEYADAVSLTYLLPAAEAERFAAEVTDATSGRAGIEDLGEQRYAVLDRELILL
ncbi:MAG: YigZ family protein [Lachnospiraceae bacterium]|nr:YigZ family protein [Lachnospiraceae bacterium]